MLTDPMKLAKSSGTDVLVHALPLVGVGLDSAIYQSADFRAGGAGTRGSKLTLSHQYNRRFRHTIRLDTVDRDDSTGELIIDTGSIILIVDTSTGPVYGPQSSVAGLVNSLLNGFSTAVNGTTNVTAVHQDFIDFLAGES